MKRKRSRNTDREETVTYIMLEYMLVGFTACQPFLVYSMSKPF